MAEAALVVEENDPALESVFLKEMIKQMRAIDTYDTYDGWSEAKIIDPFVMTAERKAEIPVIGDPDEIVMARVKAFYNAISSMIEVESKLMAVPMINLSHEGFGRVIITVGKLVVMDKTLRDVHRFGFKSIAKMQEQGEKFLSAALETINKFPEVAAA